MSAPSSSSGTRAPRPEKWIPDSTNQREVQLRHIKDLKNERERARNLRKRLQAELGQATTDPYQVPEADVELDLKEKVKKKVVEEVEAKKKEKKKDKNKKKEKKKVKGTRPRRSSSSKAPKEGDEESRKEANKEKENTTSASKKKDADDVQEEDSTDSNPTVFETPTPTSPATQTVVPAGGEDSPKTMEPLVEKVCFSALVLNSTRACDNRQWKPACWLPLSRWKASTLATIIVEVGKPARWLPS